LGVKTTISDAGGTGKELNLFSPSNDIKAPAGIPVYTERRKDLRQTVRPFSDVSGSINMNLNVGFTGTPEPIHDGGDDAGAWVGSAIAGTWNFASTDQANGGSASISAVDTGNDDEALFASGGTITMSNFTTLTGFVFLTNFSTKGVKHIEVRFRNAGVNVGNSVNLDEFIDTGDLNVWQNFAIADTNFGLNGDTVDEMVVKTVATGGGPSPDYYLDDLQWEQSGTPREFMVEADTGTWLHVHSINFVMADNISGGVANGTMPGLDYNSFLGLGKLSIGFTRRSVLGGVIEFGGVTRTVGDFAFAGSTELTSHLSNGTNTFVKVHIPVEVPIILKSELGDKLSVVINDNMSPLLLFRGNVSAGEETRI